MTVVRLIECDDWESGESRGNVRFGCIAAFAALPEHLRASDDNVMLIQPAELIELLTLSNDRYSRSDRGDSIIDEVALQVGRQLIAHGLLFGDH